MSKAGTRSDLPSDTDLNAFSRGVVRHFSARAAGEDDESRRLINTRPADHVLTGFLTPASQTSVAADAPGDDESPGELGAEARADERLAEDLPRDEAYEQTNLGMHWLVPRTALEAGASLVAHLRLHLYVRRLPTQLEQAAAAWRVPRDSIRADHPDASPVHVADAVQVWTREDLDEIPVPLIDLGQLKRDLRLQIPLVTQITAQVRQRDSSGLYPGRQPIVLRQDDARDAEAFSRWLAGLPPGQWPLSWHPVIDLRLSPVPTESHVMRLAVRVVNRTPSVPRRSLAYVDPNLYGVRLRVSIPTAAHRPTIFQELPQSFRYDREMPAVGINAHADVQARDGRTLIETVAVPTYEAARLEPRAIPDATPRFDTLATDPAPVLRRILTAMREYDSRNWEEAVARQLGEMERAEAEEARARFRDEIARFERGIELVTDQRYEHVGRAFRLMNQAMAGANRGRFEEWRLFQIVFIVSQVPILAARQHPELERPDDEDVDILWFAAGGGKTEAFLGIILWQAFFDRLRGKHLGVTAFVRFPLRLLTFQQLQRLGSALAAADLLRRKERLGGASFGIGYYVGNTTTPNDIDDDTHTRYQKQGPDEKLLRVFNCPFCGAPTELAYDPTQRLVEHRCSRSSDCPHGPSRLPIYVVDTDVYRFVPTIVVSTVDKLAQFGQNQRFAQLLGRVSALCPEHGLTFLGANRRCPCAKALDAGERPERCGASALRYGPFHDLGPSLLIQDELHLLSEELGTFDAHYETGVAELVRSLGGRPWKVVGATATIERYKEHAWHLYLRGARQFPGPGPQAYESFYYTQSRDRTGRLFVGVLGVGRKHTPAVSRALALIYLELQRARELADQDLTAACARYGLSILDRRSFDHLVFLYELLLTYVLTRKGSDQVAEAIESRVKKDLLEVAPRHGDLRVDTFNGGASEAEMSRAMQQIRAATSEGSPEDRLRGIVATNVIGHGVDVDRFNIIVFAGFPRLVAEYIQASARVGRTFPGISLFVATPQSERDRSIFDRFVKFHEYVDRLVDPAAITRWPEPAMRRTVPGILAGYLMGVAAAVVGKRLVSVEDVQALHAAGAAPLLMEAVVSWAERAYGAARAPSERYLERLRLAIQNRYSSIINQPRVQGGKPRNLGAHLGSMQSLRDTDDPGYITVGRPTDVAALRRLTRG